MLYVVAILCLIAMPNYSPHNYSLPMLAYHSVTILHSTLELSHLMIRCYAMMITPLDGYTLFALFNTAALMTISFNALAC